MATRWKKTDETYLKRYASSRSSAELAERFGVDEGTVIEKLKELRLVTKDGQGHSEPYIDPLLGVFEKGIGAFHKQQFKEAQKLLAQVEEESDQPDLAARARVYLEACRLRTASPEEPAEEDPFLEAVMAKNTGDFETAMEICSRGGRRGKDERFAYLAASIFALEGNTDEALNVLQTAIELNPKNRVHAYHDPDFDGLRGTSEFNQLFEAG